jgi:RND family efflux transporter MFP subunit
MKSGWVPTLVIVVVVTAIAVVGTLVVVRSDPDKAAAAKPAPPATATKSVKESDLNVVTLTPEAEKRLDVRVEAAERKKVPRTRFFGGQVVVPPGRSVIVSAPFAGTVAAPENAKPLAAGASVKQGQPVFALLPLLTSEARTTLTTALVDAEGMINSAEVQLDAAKVALERAKQLVGDNAAPKRTLDDAQAQFDLARKALEAAKSRRESLARAIQGGQAGSVAPLTVPSPESGVLRNVQAAPGQMVSAGAPLFEVINTDQVWIRVQVYAGDVNTVAADKPATVGLLGAAGGREAGAPKAAQPVAAPPSADALGSTVDLFYELDNTDGSLNPGERVGVTLSLRDEEESLAVPWSAVVFDINGGAWVYENVAPHAYARRRVQVRHVVDSLAVLAGGLQPGAPILTQGAAELFGYEMGFAK